MLAKASPTGTTHVAFQFRPLDASGQWRIDDVYVDPFKRSYAARQPSLRSAVRPITRSVAQVAD